METWNREELYAEVWEQPLVKVASKYGISTVALGKVCRKLQIPLPDRGYRVKKEFGKPVNRLPLSVAKKLPIAVAAFDRYIGVTEARMEDDLREDHFFFIDRLPDNRRREIDAQLRERRVDIQQLHTLEEVRAIPVPGGMIHQAIIERDAPAAGSVASSSPLASQPAVSGARITKPSTLTLGSHS